MTCSTTDVENVAKTLFLFTVLELTSSQGQNRIQTTVTGHKVASFENKGHTYMYMYMESVV